MFGLTGLVPDYSMIIVGSNMGVSKMMKEHLGITVALKIPFLIVISKVDICPPNILEETNKSLKRILRSPAVNKVPIDIQEKHNPQELRQIA